MHFSNAEMRMKNENKKSVLLHVINEGKVGTNNHPYMCHRWKNLNIAETEQV